MRRNYPNGLPVALRYQARGVWADAELLDAADEIERLLSANENYRNLIQHLRESVDSQTRELLNVGSRADRLEDHVATLRELRVEDQNKLEAAHARIRSLTDWLDIADRQMEAAHGLLDAREAEIEKWKEEARQYAQNANYWRELCTAKVSQRRQPAPGDDDYDGIRP